MPPILETISAVPTPAEAYDQLRLQAPLRAERAASSVAKRVFDILVSFVALLTTAPILALSMIAIAATSKGSPIFKQNRVGRNGEIFSIYKLRSMYVGSHMNGFKTLPEDRRLTSVGAFLRLTNIDELPQLFNILKGDMSLIGPRPLSKQETDYISTSLSVRDDYPGFIPMSRPGLVGLEQINRTRELTYLDRFKFNYHYEENWSVLLDIQIFCRAISVCREVCIASLIGAIALATMLILVWYHI